ncbi:uncharacterized protein LOC131841265 [Achroia grisella]|uniref:uncharacterized protein LOC131841265 n=1 Tax=Achroia grisella TaxID=688607 RepID=UPI0027D27576|nr:uncharacterized protein LOC131841265 [Achroia grisella]
MWAMVHTANSTPQLDIPTFQGNYNSWVSFKDLFTESIHNNPSMSNAQKMQYLKGKVKGEAERLIQHLQISSDNYSVCWDILNHRYNNTKLIFTSHINTLMNIPLMQQQSLNHIKRIHDTSMECLNAIKNLGIDTGTWDPLLVHILAQKLDSDTYNDYMESLKNPRELPILKEFLKFLETKFTTLETARKKQDNYTSKPNSQFTNQGDHNTLLHHAFTYSNKTPDANITPSSSTTAPNYVQSRSHATLERDTSEILLATVAIKVQAADGTYHRMRALLDQGSQTSLITENAAQILKIPRQRCKGVISGIGDKENSCRGAITVNCSSLNSDYTFQTEVYIMKNLIKNLPSYTFTKPSWQYLDHIKLADPEFFISKPVDLLLGADVYSNIIMDGLCRSESTLPVAQQTQLGWILSGHTTTYHKQCNVILHNSEDISRFWEIEDISDRSDMTIEDQNCIKYYQSTTKRREDGKYEVRLPLKSDYQEKLGNSKNKSIAQFYQLERKFNNNTQIASNYKLFINEYLSLGHMTPATTTVGNMSIANYLPHFCILRDSITTQLRVVFNASAKTTSNYSLNDVMYRGPNLQQDLQSLIIKWRQYKYAFTADIEKMFRQIWLNLKDQNLQKIIWRENKTEELKEYNLATVTYGTKAAPFLAMMTLKRLAQDEKIHYPNSSAPQILEESFYMDDLLHGTHSTQAVQLKQDMINLLKADSMAVLGWLQGDTDRWKPFVANRVKQVTSIMPSSCWSYVQSKENPADCASRGLTASQLREHILELKDAREIIIKEVQREEFFEEVKALKANKCLKNNSKLIEFNPILDGNGILRIGGRLRHANIDLETKHPAIIPSNTRLADLMIDEAHELTYHGGARLTTAIMRRKYWLVGGIRATKKYTSLCKM